MSEFWKEYFKSDRFAAHTGISLNEVRPGFARSTLLLDDNHLNGLGTVHGGVLFTLADFTFAAASNSYGFAAVAIQAGITFSKAIKEGTLTAEAVELSRSRRVGNYQVTIKDQTGELVATFQGVAYVKQQAIGPEHTG